MRWRFCTGRYCISRWGELEKFARVQRPARLPEVLSREETRRVLAAVEEAYALPLQLLYSRFVPSGQSGAMLGWHGRSERPGLNIAK